MTSADFKPSPVITSRVRAAVLAYNGTETIMLGDKLYFIPMSTLLN
jgi:hypothetical protein